MTEILNGGEVLSHSFGEDDNRGEDEGEDDDESRGHDDHKGAFKDFFGNFKLGRGEDLEVLGAVFAFIGASFKFILRDDGGFVFIAFEQGDESGGKLVFIEDKGEDVPEVRG